VTAVAEPLVFGKQTPRVRSVPDAPVSLGDKVIEFAAKAGLFLDPWQQLVLRDSLGVLPGGKWAAPRVGLLCPRQNGKGAILEALELFHMFVLQTPLIVHSAHKFDTSQEHFLRLRALIESNPDLERHVKSMPTSQGHEAIVLRNGNRLKFKARTVGGAGRGFSADLLILDEAMLLPEQALDAMLPTLAARKNPQVWFTSSAGTPDSAALWRIVKRGRERSPRLAYFEWGCESGIDVLDRQNWADANPGLGYRLAVDYLNDELNDLSPDGFAREHLGIWDDAASAAAIDYGQWMTLADPDAERGREPVVRSGYRPGPVMVGDRGGLAPPDGLVHIDAGRLPPDATWVAGGSPSCGPAGVAGPGRSGIPRAAARRRQGVAGGSGEGRQRAVGRGDRGACSPRRRGGDGHGGARAPVADLQRDAGAGPQGRSADISPLVAASLAHLVPRPIPDYNLLDSVR
jgi:hypothetical protein